MPCLQCGKPTRGDSYCAAHRRTPDFRRGSRQDRGLGGTWPRLSRQVLARDGYVCWICGRDGADTADHIIPRQQGGTNDPQNLRAAHRACNSRRGIGG